MTPGRTSALIGAIAVAVGLLAACSSSLSQTDVQDKLTAGMSEQIGGDYTISCPSDIPATAGGTFMCDTTGADGSTGVITVTQTDDQGNLSWEYTPAS